VFQTVVNKESTGIPLQQQQQQQQQISPSQPVREQVVIGGRDASGRVEAEDQSQSFLKKKEEELRQKRERERQTTVADAKSKPAADAAFVAAAPPGDTNVKVMTPSPTPAAGGVKRLEFVPVTTLTTPAETVSTSLISPPVQTAVTASVTLAADKTPKTVTAVTVPPVVTAASYQPVRPVPAADANIPQFYFPLGTPAPCTADLEETTVKKIRDEFDKADDGKLGKNALGPVVQVCLSVLQ